MRGAPTKRSVSPAGDNRRYPAYNALSKPKVSQYTPAPTVQPPRSPALVLR
ncbi:MAG TPA: hypothetical protein VLN49_19620 [Gemmatimonadaceae bacterium]|nr:hypothetical protein [Gemmatimonadaceae bacterium]